jgi:hypothetical protein
MAKKAIPNPMIKPFKCKYCNKTYSKDQWKGKKEFDGYICQSCLANTMVVSTGEDEHGNMPYKRVNKI